MSTIDGSTTKKIIKISSLVMLILLVMVGGYIYYKYQTYKSIKVVMKDSAAVEYGSANYDINKLVKEVEGEIVSVKKDVDTNKLGKQNVVVEVKKNNVVKDVTIPINVVDTAAPIINIKEEKITLTEGDDYDLTSNIESVSDSVDGSIAYLNEANDDSKFYYDFTYGEDIDNVGEHEVVVNAKDKHGNVSKVKFTIEVVPRKIVTPVNVQTSNNTNNQTYSNLPANAAGGDLVSIAYSLVGSPYISGSNGPYGFDCSGFVQYVYSRVGINVSRSSYTQIYDGVGVSYADAKPGDILSWGYADGAPTHSALYVGNGQMIHATNPSQGVIASDVAAWTRGSGTHVIAVRRIN